MSQQGGGSIGGGALEVPPVEDIMKTEAQQVVGARMVRMAAAMFDCHACRLPLKRPIFKCDADHLVCWSCRGVHGEACGRPVAQSTLADAFAAAALVECDYEGYGCNVGDVVYHEAADHRLACQHAPCGCPERCGFSDSPQKLLKHISGPEHSRTVIVVRYGQPGVLSLSLSLRWQVLVGEADRSVFLVSVGDRGAEVEVSLVCVRAADGGAVAPQFSCKIAVEHSDDGTRETLKSPVMKSSSLSNGTPAPDEVKKRLTVKKEYLPGDSVPLSIRIDRLAQPPPKFAPFSPNPKSPPFSPTRPFSPKSPPFSPTRPFSPKPSPKRPFSPNPSPKPAYAASPPPAPVATTEEKCNKRSCRK